MKLFETVINDSFINNKDIITHKVPCGCVLDDKDNVVYICKKHRDEGY